MGIFAKKVIKRVQIGYKIEEKLLKQFKKICDDEGGSYTEGVELAMKRLIDDYKNEKIK